MSRAVQRLRQQFPQRGATPSSRPYGRYATTSTPDELASCYLHALTAAGNLTSKTAIQRIVKVSAPASAATNGRSPATGGSRRRAS
jgi:hypothetical protein